MPRILLRRNTSSGWTSANPVLADGEMAVETDTGRAKLGDGASVWLALPYLAPTIDAAKLTTGTLSEARLPDLSGTYVTPGSRPDSLLLAQQAPLGGVRVDPFHVRAANATTACFMPTPDGGNQVVEPCVIHFPFGWNGYEYWAVVSSYPGGDATKENPSILCSHDGDTWQVPAGLTNPIDAPVSGGGYVDGTLVMDGDTMWCVYNTGPFYAKSSTDGVHWTDRISLTISGASATGIGPMLARRGDDYYLWVSNNDARFPYVLRLFKSTTGIAGTFEYVSDCTFPAIVGRDVWERNVCVVGDQFVAIWGYCLAGTGGADCKQHLAVSTDGITWTIDTSPVLDRGGPDAIDNQAIYRSTIVPLDGRSGKLFDCWYGAMSESGGAPTVFKVARTTIEYDPPVQRGAWQRAPRAIGFHYPPNDTVATASKGQLVNVLLAAPCWTDQDIWIDQLAVSVSAAGVGATGRLGIYLPMYPQRPFGDARLIPGATLLLDAGTVDASTTGLKTLDLTTPLKIPAGMFWLAGVAQGAQIGTWCSWSNNAVFSPLGLSGGGMQGVFPTMALRAGSSVTGAMPTTLAFYWEQRQTQDFGVTYRLAARPTT